MKRFLAVLIASMFLGSAAYAADAMKEEKKAAAESKGEKSKGEKAEKSKGEKAEKSKGEKAKSSEKAEEKKGEKTK
jgi:opacity protein-like surface antigen